MEYLLLSICAIIIYSEVLPTLTLFFDLIRTWIASKIAIIQQNTVHVQEDIQDTQARMEPSNTHVIGFQAPSNSYETEEYDDE